jgi:hypothetical protein
LSPFRPLNWTVDRCCQPCRLANVAEAVTRKESSSRWTCSQFIVSVDVERDSKLNVQLDKPLDGHDVHAVDPRLGAWRVSRGETRLD